jgi:hypothetical protein
MQDDVGERGAEHPSLGGSGSGVEQSTVCQYHGLQPANDQPQHSTIRDALPQTIEQHLFSDRVKAVGDVGVDHPDPPPLDLDSDRIERLVRQTSRPKAIGAVEEVGFEGRLQHRLGRRLDDSVTNARNPQVAVAAISLGDRDPPDRKQAVGAVFELSLHVVEKCLDALLLDV